MKNIILIGASRAGKSTFTRMLEKKLDNLIIIQTDLLRLAFREAVIEDLNISTSNLKNNPLYRNFVLSYYKFLDICEVNYIKVIDTVDFEPKDKELFKNALVLCFGYPDISEEEVLKNFRKYDTDLDWTKKKNDNELLAFIHDEVKYSKYLKGECQKYDIKFVNTSFDRMKNLEETLDYIIKNIAD